MYMCIYIYTHTHTPHPRMTRCTDRKEDGLSTRAEV